MKSFGTDGGGALSQASTSFAALQSGDGPLTTEFMLGGVPGRRMVTGYHAWRLQRINRVLKSCTETQDSRTAVTTSATSPFQHSLLDLRYPTTLQRIADTPFTSMLLSAKAIRA